MARIDIVRAWKDEAYRRSLSEAERISLPDNPAGMIDLADSALDGVAGGSDDTMLLEARTQHVVTLGCCGGLTTDPNVCTLLCTLAGAPGCPPPTYDFSCK
jgi:mersacidin/lichenicidin family type 2 lantibiotic